MFTVRVRLLSQRHVQHLADLVARDVKLRVADADRDVFQVRQSKW